jgi:superoxide dismutase, Cu-Zn family
MTTKMGRAATIAIVGLGLATGTAAALPKLIQSNEDLTDFATPTAQATDGARAHVLVEGTDAGGTRVVLQVTGLEHDAVGRTLGAHVHRGSCTEDNGAGALGHYKHGDQTAVATPENEIWLDFVVQPGGVGFADTTVGFTIPDGAAGSVVIHERATDNPGGAAGARYACIPVNF